MTAEQREKFADYIVKGAKYGEAAGMCGVNLAALQSYWQAGASDRDADAAAFVSACRAARARYCATIRATAEAAAGSRESPDLLAVVREVESDPEPANVDTSSRVNSSDLVASDLLAGDSLTTEERSKLSAEHETFVRSGLMLFGTILAVQDRQRTAVVPA